jgi:hypothetical protein
LIILTRSFHHLALAVTALLFFLASINISLSAKTLALSLAVFTGTFFIYRLSVWVPVLSWSLRLIDFNSKPNTIELVTLPLIILSTFYFLNFRETTLLIYWGLFSTCYFLNIKLGAFHFKGLRSVPLIKTIHLSLLWTIIGFIFKQEIATNSVHISEFIIRFVILFIICLGVDLRDITKDKKSATRTLATLLGFYKLKQLMLITNLALICFLILNAPDLTLELLIASMLFIGISYLKINSKPITFTILMDGTLMLYSFLAFMTQLTRF